MKTKILALCLVSFLHTPFNLAWAQEKTLEIEKSIKKYNWNGIDVVFIEDPRFPTYDLTIYFADGALSDEKGEYGLTNHAFNLLDSGTSKLTQQQILEELEFYGTEINADVTHEFSTISVSGMTKDIKPAMAHACHVLKDANYPQEIIKKEIELEKNGLKNLVSSPQGLAERVFRNVSMSGTPYSYPVSGKLEDLDNYHSVNLKQKLNYFLNSVKKRIYITGPKSALQLESILINECGLKGNQSDFVREVTNPQRKNNVTELIFVPIPDANQVQLRIGRFLNDHEISERNLDYLASDLLGGGFTSRLMREVRTKRGLTYSIGSFISSQKQYGRAGISTFTKNETINKLIDVIDETITKIVKNGITDEEFNHAMEGVVGSYPFRFENNSAFLGQLMYLDHISKPYTELFLFKESVKGYSKKDIQRKVDQMFSLDKQVIFVLGDSKIENSLRKLSKKYGKLRVLNYKDYL